MEKECGKNKGARPENRTLPSAQPALTVSRPSRRRDEKFVYHLLNKARRLRRSVMFVCFVCLIV